MLEPMIHTARIEHGEKPTCNDSPNQLFPWWSVTKTALAACALQLVGQGRLQLDRTLPKRPYTLRQLLQHRAGVREYGRLPAYHEAVARGDEPWTVDELLERVGADRLDFSPGKGWAYSNVGYLLLRRIIEETLDTDIGTALHDLVFAPLDLLSPRLVTMTSDLDATAWGNADRYHPGWVYHGLLVGTAIDAAGFLGSLLSGRLLPPDLLDEMTTRHPIGGPIPGRPWETTGYGLGLMMGCMSGVGMSVGHSGAGPGSVCAVYHFPDAHPPCTAAAFGQYDDEGVTEHALARLVV